MPVSLFPSLRLGPAVLLVCAGCASAPSPAPAPPPASPSPSATPAPELPPLVQLQRDSEALASLMKTDLGRAFLGATAALTPPAPRTLLKDPKSERCYSPAASAKLDADVRKTLLPVSEREVTELFYNTYHGTPLAYARAIDLLGTAGLKPRAGQRLADFGFGNVGQMRMLAALGFDTVGIEVSPFLADLYAHPSDQGRFGGGSVKMVFGRYPGDAAVAAAVGGGLDVFLSKNTLKRGYIHPYRTPGKPEWVIQLGVTDEVFLKTIHDALKPGGLFLIYNICPALTPEDKPFVTWTDGRSPFSREQFAAAGFEVLAFDVDDREFVREMGRRLRWDQGADAFDLVHDLSVLYTFAQRI